MSRPTYTIRIASRERELVSIRDFELPEKQIVFLFGESGIGKSLVAKALYGLLDPTELHVTINGRSYRRYLEERQTHEIREDGFFVFQEPSSHLNPLMSVREQLREGSLSGAKTQADILRELWNDTAAEELRRILAVYPTSHRPSGGEKQRILSVMAFTRMDLMREKNRERTEPLFVFDEPTGSLDNRYRDVFLSMLFERFEQSPAGILLITHDYSMITVVTDRFRHLLDRISFRELHLLHGQLQSREFSARTYLEWLSEQQPVANDEQERRRPAEPLLCVESGIEMYGNRLLFTKEGDRDKVSSLSVSPGAMVFLKGPSGTGKTTVAKTVMGLIRGMNFHATLRGITLNESTPRRLWQREIWGRRMSMVFQHADEALNLRSTVREVFQGLPIPGAVTDTRIREWLQLVFGEEEESGFLGRKVDTLSGGQKQRLNLLRSLVLDTDLLLLDEPLNGLDFESLKRVIGLLQEKQREGKGILVISHNEEVFDALVRKEERYCLVRVPVAKHQAHSPNALYAGAEP